MRQILTVICNDTKGIIATISNFLLSKGANILQSNQYSDDKRFFLRLEYNTPSPIADEFGLIAQQFNMNYNIYDADAKPRLLIAVSKEGHCLNNLLHRYKNGALNVEIPAIISNHTSLQEMAEWYNIPFIHIPSDDKKTSEQKIMDIIDSHNIDLVVLARYMQILSNELCSQLEGRAINIHHSFLPSFKGANPYRQAFERGVKIIGATAHYVTPELDEGPIIEQEITRVNHTQSVNDLKLIGQDIEARVLSNAINNHINHRVLINGNKTVIF